MSTAVLFFRRWDDREGIIPVDTFVYPSTVSSNYLKLVNWYLEKMLSEFVEVVEFWVTSSKEYNPQADDGYGLVYGYQQANHRYAISKDPFKAARTIISYLIESDTWKVGLLEDSSYSAKNFTVEDLPTEAPTLKIDPPVDSRFTKGDIVVNRRSTERFTYMGVFHDAFNDHSNLQSRMSSGDNTVTIGVENDEWVKEANLVEFMSNRKFDVYPMPNLNTSIIPKTWKWFTRTFGTKEEGYGPTQKHAKETLALKIM